MKNRRTAILVAVAISILATILGVFKSMSKLTRDVESMFYEGVYLKSEGFTEPAINSHLDKSAQSALNLGTLLQEHPELTGKADSLLAARRDLLDSGDIRSKNAADRRMVDSFVDLVQAARNAGLPERDVEGVKQYQSTFAGAHMSIAASHYHDEVEQYLKETSFLAQVISLILPVNPPAKFDRHLVKVIEF